MSILGGEDIKPLEESLAQSKFETMLSFGGILWRPNLHIFRMEVVLSQHAKCNWHCTWTGVLALFLLSGTVTSGSFCRLPLFLALWFSGGGVTFWWGVGVAVTEMTGRGWETGTRPPCEKGLFPKRSSAIFPEKKSSVNIRRQIYKWRGTYVKQYV